MESPCKEELELAKRRTDLSFNAFLLMRAHHARRSGKWEGYKEEFQKSGKPSVWASVKVKECEAKVFRAHAAPQGLCDNLVNSLKLLTKKAAERMAAAQLNILSQIHGKRIAKGSWWAQEVHRSGQSRSSECGRPAPRRKIRPGDKATVYSRFPRCSHQRRSGRTDTES